MKPKLCVDGVPWLCEKQDRRLMSDWVNPKLDELDFAAYQEAHSPANLAAFERNFMARVRTQKPRRGRGRPRGSVSPRTETLQIASIVVDQVRELWRRHFGRVNRPWKTNRPTAVEIVQERLGLTPTPEEIAAGRDDLAPLKDGNLDDYRAKHGRARKG
jgi:hypothetical protein